MCYDASFSVSHGGKSENLFYIFLVRLGVNMQQMKHYNVETIMLYYETWHSCMLPLLDTITNHTRNLVLSHCKRLMEYHSKKFMSFVTLVLGNLYCCFINWHTEKCRVTLMFTESIYSFAAAVSILSNLLQLVNWEQPVCLEDDVYSLVVLLGRKLCSMDKIVLFCYLLVSMWSILLLGKP